MPEAPFSAHDANRPDAAVYGEQELADGSRLVWALSRREFGPMSFGNRPEWDVTHNRMQFLKLHGLKIDDVVSPFLGHTSNVEIVGEADKSRGARDKRSAPQQVDALLTKEPGVVLLTTHADCLPVWLCAPASGWIGMAHVGRRGLLAGIVGNLVNTVPEAEREGVTVSIGPGISTAHYEVSEEIAAEFDGHPVLNPTVRRDGEHAYLDLLTGVRLEAEAAGASVIEDAWRCTFDNRYLSSYRREGEAAFTPMAAIIARRIT